MNEKKIHFEISSYFPFFLTTCTLMSMAKGTAQISNKAVAAPFAEIIGKDFVIKADTTAFKKMLKENFFGDDAIVPGKVVIRKQLTLGDIKQEFYYVLVSDKRQNKKIARWLSRNGNALYLNDNFDGVDSFEQIYLSCASDCLPNVTVTNDKRSWNCRKNLTDTKKEEICTSAKTVIFKD